MRKRYILISLLAVLGLYQFSGLKEVWQAKIEQDRIAKRDDRIARNERFNILEEAYWPKPVRLQDHDILIISQEGKNFCETLCSQLMRSGSGARLYYAAFTSPDDVPDFAQSVDLRAIAQGRMKIDPDAELWMNRFLHEPFQSDEVKPTFEHVVVHMNTKITPILNVVLPEIGFSVDLGHANTIFAPVHDDRAYQMTHKNVHYIDYKRKSEAFDRWYPGGHLHSPGYWSEYGTDEDAELAQLHNAICGPNATTFENCADDIDFGR